ncbi:bifunctional UDP-N-acetylglucosamine diphosphorylase/glucosamine-1-phosphate N-acetyltransferase GlmU [Actinocorallia lasiicapitis]
MLGHVLVASGALEPQQVLVVVGHRREQVIEHLAEVAPDAVPVVQETQNGTGHAVRIALDGAGDLDGVVVVANGDMPLLRAETLHELVATHSRDGNAVTLLTTDIPDPSGYGRILRDADGAVTAIVEHKDATDEQRLIHEMNVGLYVFDGKLLAAALARLTTANASGEEYLTDVVEILRNDGHRAGAYKAPDWVETQGVNDRVQLAQARRQLNDRILDGLMRAGVTVVDPATTWVDVQVAVEPDVVLHPNTQLHGHTVVQVGAEVGPDCTITNTLIGEDARVTRAVAVDAEVGPAASVGPYAYLRPGSRLGRGSKVGTYVEMKNSVLGEGSKVPHLTYVGDGDIGQGSNIGAACVFVNYDGVSKHRTTVGDHVRIGSDNMLVAPVTVGDGAYTAAGSVIIKDVPPGAMAVARGQQRNVEGWVERKRAGTAAAEAAKRARGIGTQEGDK